MRLAWLSLRQLILKILRHLMFKMTRVESGSTFFRGPTVNQHMREREAEKTADLESLADALAAFRQLHRDLDQWERVHPALGLAAVVSGCYGIGALEAALALTPEIERMAKEKLHTYTG